MSDIVSNQTVAQNPKIVTSDGIEFWIETDDVINLTNEQFQLVYETAGRRKARYVIEDGIDVSPLNQQQCMVILSEILSRIGRSEEPLKDNKIILSNHIQFDHIPNIEVLVKRGWYKETVKEIYADIECVIMNVVDIQKAKLKFLDIEKKSQKRFSFTVVGLKVNGEIGRVSISFISVGGDSILAVTII